MLSILQAVTNRGLDFWHSIQIMDEQHDHHLHAIFVEEITGIHNVLNVKILVPNYLEVSVLALPKI